ncbi:MAG: glycosyltransferase family 2 protein [Prolixibacteraceae bacterium]|nr:glycosyltransferase family 2 protein [Prolixibacteraceae bacterium]
MKIDIITMWYNEASLAPFFLNHYSYADTIHILLDEEVNDNTQKIAEKYENVRIIPVRFPDKLDDILKIETINSIYHSIDSDWVIVVDSDEFVFSLPFYTNIRDILENESKYNLFNVQLWQVYRHRDDNDLNPDLPAIFQRRHGDPNVTTGLNSSYVKPIIVHSGLEIEWQPGCHLLARKNIIRRLGSYVRGKNAILSPHLIHGVHWAMADPAIAIKRRIDRKDRLSKRNIETRLGFQNIDITEEQIRRECDQHLDDPLLF